MDPLPVIWSVIWKVVSPIVSLVAKTKIYESRLSKPVERLSRFCWGPRLQMSPNGPLEVGGQEKYHLLQIKVLNQSKHWCIPNLNPLENGMALVRFFDEGWKPYGKPMLSRTRWTIKRGQEDVINIAVRSKIGQCCGYGMGIIYKHGWFMTMLPVSPDDPDAVTARRASPWEFVPGKKYFLKVTVGNDKIICTESYFVLRNDMSVENFRLEIVSPPETARQGLVC
jgi:hypothetical protein